MTERGDNVIAFDRLDRARELEAEQQRLAKRLAELEVEMQARISAIECHLGSRGAA